MNILFSAGPRKQKEMEFLKMLFSTAFTIYDEVFPLFFLGKDCLRNGKSPVEVNAIRKSYLKQIAALKYLLSHFDKHVSFGDHSVGYFAGLRNGLFQKVGFSAAANYGFGRMRKALLDRGVRQRMLMMQRHRKDFRSPKKIKGDQMTRVESNKEISD